MNNNESGAVSRQDWSRMRNHANQYYEQIRNRQGNSDVVAIANNTGIPAESIQKVKEHMFFNTYDLYGGHKRFDPNFDMAVSWQSLIDGTNIREMDIIMLRHELMEYHLMNDQKLSYSQAHEMAENAFNYAMFTRELNAKEGVF